MAAKKTTAVKKATTASKAVLKGGKFQLKKKKVMNTPTFRRPKTKITPRKPKVINFILDVSVEQRKLICNTESPGNLKYSPSVDS